VEGARALSLAVHRASGLASQPEWGGGPWRSLAWRVVARTCKRRVVPRAVGPVFACGLEPRTFRAYTVTMYRSSIIWVLPADRRPGNCIALDVVDRRKLKGIATTSTAPLAAAAASVREALPALATTPSRIRGAGSSSAGRALPCYCSMLGVAGSR
jgi:hypothetical protein